jgi:hypothetical protein
MVFKLRDKSLFWTTAGWRNNWYPKSFCKEATGPSEVVSGVTTNRDYLSFLRSKIILK